MRKVIEEKKIYLFSELSDEAKEKVRNWYLENQDTYIFSEDCREDLNVNIFPNSQLDVEYSLSYCQGDGFNIFGNLDIDDFINYASTEYLSNKEIRLLKFIKREFSRCIMLPVNPRYGYCYVDTITFADDIIEEMEYAKFRDIPYNDLEHIEYAIKDSIQTLCKKFEENGYDFFYEISDEDLEEVCDANCWEFLEDGSIY